MVVSVAVGGAMMDVGIRLNQFRRMTINAGV